MVLLGILCRKCQCTYNLRYFHNIIVHFIKSVKMWQCLVYHHLITFSFSFGTTGNKQFSKAALALYIYPIYIFKIGKTKMYATTI